MGKNQIDVFWEFYNQNPGPLFAGTLFVSIVEGISSFFLEISKNQIIFLRDFQRFLGLPLLKAKRAAELQVISGSSHLARPRRQLEIMS